MYQAMLILSDQTALPVSAQMTAEDARTEVDRIKGTWYLNRRVEQSGGWLEVRPAT